MFGEKGFPYKRLLSLLIVVLSPILYVGIPTRIAFNEWFIDWEYSKADFPKDRFGLEDDYRKYLAKLGLKAVLSEGMEEFRRARLPDGRRAFREKEIKHMEDVRDFLKLFFPFLYISIAFTVLAFFIIGDPRLIGKVLVSSSIFSFILVAGAGAFALLDYDLAFEVFHNYIFDPYSWRFKPTDTLLRIYPMKFWYDGTIFVLVLSGLLSLISLLLGLFLIRYRRWS